MIGNYLTLAIRNLRKYRFYTLINVLGLTTGITACLVIFLFVRHELSYDRFHERADDIVRIDWEVQFGGQHTYNAALTPPMAAAFVREFEEVEAAARLRYSGSFQFKREVENLVVPGVVYADNDLFKIFSYPFVAGNPEFALTHPNSLVITESAAARFYPNENALGKTLIKDNQTLYTITGIIRDIPENAHFHYDIFLSMEGLSESKNENWIGGPFNTYLLLRKGTDPTAFEKKLPLIANKYVLPHATAVLGNSFMDDFMQEGNHLTLHVMPLTDIHLYSHLRNELEGNGDIKYVYLLSIIALFILVIAGVNFTNLATARSVKRAREIGIRKVMGSGRTSITIQFLSESIILSLISFCIALAITDVTLPLFNRMTGAHLMIPYSNPLLAGSLILVALGVGIAAGLYPGFVLSRYKPTEVLKGKIIRSDGSSFLRSGLVVFQFTISIFLTIATLAIIAQMRYMQRTDLGFKKEQVIRMVDVINAGDQLVVFRDEMLKNPMLKNATISSYFPGPGSARNTPLIWQYGSEPRPDNSVNIEKWLVDYHYVETLGMQVIAGRNFSPDFPSDSSGVLINQSAAYRLGLGDNPVGQRLSLFRENPDGSQDRSQLESFTIIGILKDFNYESLRENVQPLGLFFGRSRGSIAFRYETHQTDQVIGALESTWKRIAPGEPFNYTFLDEDFQKTFSTEKKLGNIFTLFSGLAIVIACMGLFALTAFTAEQRTKEIGIRKVMGASEHQIVQLLAMSFGKLILISMVLAVPLAALGISWYLQQYAYRTEISIGLYLKAGLLAFLLGTITIGYQSLKAARANPVDSLKHE